MKRTNYEVLTYKTIRSMMFKIIITYCYNNGHYFMIQSRKLKSSKAFTKKIM